MEADSTTYDNNPKALLDVPCLPFNTCPGNFKLYTEFVNNSGEKRIESQIVERLQSFGLLPNHVICHSDTPDCKVICRAARVVDRLQWACKACGKKQPIRVGVKTRVAAQIYDRLDELAIQMYSKSQLGGPNSVVLADLYPDCLNRLSPDTTDHPHHMPTYYRLHRYLAASLYRLRYGDGFYEHMLNIVATQYTNSY
ncbi:Uncharacterized protein OBRU01_16467 [Operophtera brumata]|uniref:Uncharacterized protein n=1 Tax=Operophtera brumata TaxID=104452 RepID=A0A0L7L2Q7_OPEBR|nr:Uncharacterized protein OBRU01_16467 [Operophtera brumata]